MRRLRTAVAALAPILAIGAACLPPPAVVIDSPPPGGEVTWMPLDVEIRLARGIAPASLVVLLNGVDVSDSFTVAPPANGWQVARAADLWDGLVRAGANQLEVRAQAGAQGYVVPASFSAIGDPFADALVSVTVGEFGGFPGPGFLPGFVIGPPRGTGLLQGNTNHVYSLGFGGEMVLGFTNNVMVDGPGVDFTVFENAFMAENPATLVLERPFSDPGFVSVSQDGVVWHAFPCLLVRDYPNGIVFPGCAGVYPVLSNATQPATPHASIPTEGEIGDLMGVSSVPLPEPGGSGGDSFDLADVGLAWARYVRVEDADFVTGDPFGSTNAGFDVDAVAAVNSAPATDANGNGVPDAVD
jgi:hypothetical protein